jgi:hypothetical protein
MLQKKYLNGSAKRKLKEKKEEIKKLRGNLNKYVVKMNTETSTSLITDNSKSK